MAEASDPTPALEMSRPVRGLLALCGADWVSYTASVCVKSPAAAEGRDTTSSETDPTPSLWNGPFPLQGRMAVSFIAHVQDRTASDAGHSSHR